MMKYIQNILTKYPLMIVVIGVSLLLLLPQVFQQGLFFDGLTYSSVANNLALGRGSAWDPMYAEVVYKHFHEHPPLMFWIESWFMALFNGAFYVEKVFGFICAVLTGILLVAIYRKLNGSKKSELFLWLPLLLWITIPKVFWSYNNNMLENLLSVFVLACVYFFAKVLKNESRWKSLIWGSLFLFLGFMTKGIVALFPLVVLVIYAVIYERNQKQIIKRLGETAMVILLFVLLLGGMFLIVPKSYTFFTSYFDVQVMSSIAGKRRTGVRIMLLYDVLMELIPMLIFLVLSLVILFKQRIERIQVKQFLFFLLIALSGTLPLMISPKLSAFYLVPAFPFYALACAVLLLPFYQNVLERLRANDKLRKALSGFGLLLIVAAITWTIAVAGSYYRDKEIITDAKKIAEYNSNKEMMSISHAMKNDWTTMAYFQRYHQISFDIHTDTLQYILLMKEEVEPAEYEIVELELDKFKLLKRK